jgi:hypothetical protein
MANISDQQVARELAETLPQDLQLNLATNDLIFSNGDILLVKGLPAVQQQLSLTLKTFLGEWFLDEQIGVPYFQQIFVKRPSVTLIETVFRSAILACPGIAEIDSLKFTLNRESREGRVDFKARTDWGELIESAIDTGALL